MKENKILKILIKIKDFIAKYDILFIILLMVLICLGKSVLPELNSGDDIWNFNNAYKMSNGLNIYSDGNAIITPLFYYLCMIVFKIFGPTYIAFRIYNILIYTALFTLIYCLFRTLKISKIRSFLYMLILPFMVLFSTVEIGANYNILLLVFVVSGVILYINKLRTKDKKTLFEVFHGINIFLLLLTKQNAGAFYIIAITLAEFCITDNFKKAFFSLLRQAIVVLTLIGVFIGYMAVIGQLEGFIDYCILGMLDFGSSNVSFNMNAGTVQSILFYMAIITWCVALFILTVKKENIIKDEVKNNIVLLFIVSLFIMGLVYPIGNSYHFRQAFVMTGILLMYVLDTMIIKDFFKKEEYLMLFATILSFCVLASSAGSFTNWLKADKEQDIEVYKNIRVNDNIKEKINKITEYITKKKEEGIEVIILSQYAALYNIPLKISNGAMDLPFKGNLGKGGEDGLLEEIKSLENKQILLYNGSIFWQESEKINDYIKENFNYIEPVGDFYVYENTK